MSLLRKIPTILGAGGGGIPAWRQHLQPCEYLETDGNCYIRTPFNCNDITTIKIKAYNSYTNTYTIQGWTSGGQLSFTCNGNNKIACRAWNNIETVSNLNKNQNITLKIEGTKIYFNSEEHNRPTKQDVNVILTIFSSSFSHAGIKIFNDFETNLFRMITCYVIDEYTDNKGNLCSSGVAGMVDTLTGTFYTNDGTGTFTHGADINI